MFHNLCLANDFSFSFFVLFFLFWMFGYKQIASKWIFKWVDIILYISQVQLQANFGEKNHVNISNHNNLIFFNKCFFNTLINCLPAHKETLSHWSTLSDTSVWQVVFVIQPCFTHHAYLNVNLNEWLSLLVGLHLCEKIHFFIQVMISHVQK